MVLLSRYGIASVIGWLPAEISEFVSEKTSQPAPLWRIVFDEAHQIESNHTSDSTRVEAFCELGMEDLEEDEVRIARALFLTHIRDAKELKYLSWYRKCSSCASELHGMHVVLVHRLGLSLQNISPRRKWAAALFFGRLALASP